MVDTQLQSIGHTRKVGAQLARTTAVPNSAGQACDPTTSCTTHCCRFSACRVRVGAKVGLQWTLAFSYWTYTNTSIPPVNVAISPASPQASQAAVTATLQDTQQASTPLSGWFGLAIGEFCDTAVGDSAEAVQAKLEQLPGVSPGVDVERSGSVHDGFTYTVTFPALSGDVASLRVANASMLAGSRPRVTTSVVQAGSPELFYGPIPAELLRVPVSTSKGIALEVNGVSSACGPTVEGAGRLQPGSITPVSAVSACTFEASASATPTLSSVVPNGTIIPINILVRGVGRGVQGHSGVGRGFDVCAAGLLLCEPGCAMLLRALMLGAFLLLAPAAERGADWHWAQCYSRRQRHHAGRHAVPEGACHPGVAHKSQLGDPGVLWCAGRHCGRHETGVTQRGWQGLCSRQSHGVA